jgi:hypothetical protein
MKVSLTLIAAALAAALPQLAAGQTPTVRETVGRGIVIVNGHVPGGAVVRINGAPAGRGLVLVEGTVRARGDTILVEGRQLNADAVLLPLDLRVGATRRELESLLSGRGFPALLVANTRSPARGAGSAETLAPGSGTTATPRAGAIEPVILGGTGAELLVGTASFSGGSVRMADPLTGFDRPAAQGLRSALSGEEPGTGVVLAAGTHLLRSGTVIASGKLFSVSVRGFALQAF